MNVPVPVICVTTMDLYGPMFLLFTSFVVTIHCLPDELKSLPDPSVFVMKPPKEFMNLFQPDDSKNLTNPMKSLLSNKNASNNLLDLSKFLPDPSVFEMIPPKEFVDLFRLKEKENVDAGKDTENLINLKKESSNFEVRTVPDLQEPIVVNMKPSKESLDTTDRDTENFGSSLKEISGIITNLPDKKYIPDPKVFEMEPPKEFLDLFKFRSGKKIDNQRDNILSSINIPSDDMVTTLSDEKSIQDPSVYEIKPAKDYLNLIQFKQKEDSDKSKKESSDAIVPSHSIIDEKKTLSNQNVFDMKPPQEFTNLFNFQDKEESNKPLKWPSWSFEMNNYGEKINLPNWFYLSGLKPREYTKIDKHTEPNEAQKPQDEHWNQQTFESHSFYDQSPPGNKQFKPFNMFIANEHLPGQNIFNIKEDDNDIQVRSKDDSKTITHTKTDILKFTTEKTDKISDTTNGKAGDVVIAKSGAVLIDSPTKFSTTVLGINDEKGESINKNSDAIIIPKDDILVKKDTTEFKPVKIKSNEKLSLVSKNLDKQLQQSPPKISVLDNSIVIPVQLLPSQQTQHYGLGNMVFMSTLYPSPNYGFPKQSEGYRFEYTNQPNNQVYLSPYNSEVKPDALALSGKVEHDLSSPSDKPKSNHDLLQTQNVKPNDIIISSIKPSSKDNDPSGLQVAAMIIPSKTVPQTRSVISGNNMVINNGDKLANVDQIINGTPAPNAYNFPSHEESNQEGYVSNVRPETNLGQGNIPNSPPLVGQSISQPAFGSNGIMLSQNNYPQNQKPETTIQGNIPANPPNLNQPVNYPPFVPNSNNMVGQSQYPQYQQPVFMNVPYGSNGVPLNYVFANGAPLLNGQMTNNQNYQLNSGQGVVVPSPMVGGYSQNSLYALVPISKPKPYFNNNVSGNGYQQVPGQVFNIVPAQNNMLLTTKDQE